MNKIKVVVALLLAGLMVGTIGVLCANQESKSASEDPLFIG
jgi:hypothetical protein